MSAPSNNLSQYFAKGDILVATDPTYTTMNIHKFKVTSIDDKNQTLNIQSLAYPNAQPAPYKLVYHLYTHDASEPSDDPEAPPPTYTPTWKGFWGRHYDSVQGFTKLDDDTDTQ